MKKTTLLGVMAGLCLLANAQGQEIRPLTIGDTMPDITFNNLINYPTPTAKLSDFKDKVIVLDFFATWCTSCIAALPHLDGLQKELKEKVQVVVISDEPLEKIKTFLENSPVAKKIDMSFVYEDNLLRKYFPHSGIPHEIVLYQNKVAAITYPEYINHNTINSLWSTGKIDAPLKTTATEGRSMVSTKRDINSNLLKRMQITSYDPRYNFGQAKTYSNDSTKRLYLMNSNLINLYSRALNAHTIGYRLLLEVADENRFLRPKDAGKHEWAIQNTYCYDLTMQPNVSDEEMQQTMAADLNQYFHLNGRIEKRKIKCYALQLIDSTLLIEKNTSLKPSLKLHEAEDVKEIINLPLSHFFAIYNTPRYPESPPQILLNETCLISNISIRLAIDSIFNLEQLGKAVVAYGLIIRPVERDVHLMVISNVKNPN